MTADEAAAHRGGAAAGGARHRLPRLLAFELPRRDDRGDRPRGGHLRADPLPALRLEARPLPRVPRRGLGELPRAAERAIADDPTECLGAIADAYMAKGKKIRVDRPVDPGADDLGRGQGDRGRAAPADPRGARLLRRADPGRPEPRRRARRPRLRGRGVDLRRRRPARDDRPAASAVCSATTCERVRTERRRWMAADLEPANRPRHGKAPAAAPGALPGQAGRRLGGSRKALALRPSRSFGCRLWRSPCTRPGVRPWCKVDSLYEPVSHSVK